MPDYIIVFYMQGLYAYKNNYTGEKRMIIVFPEINYCMSLETFIDKFPIEVSCDLASQEIFPFLQYYV